MDRRRSCRRRSRSSCSRWTRSPRFWEGRCSRRWLRGEMRRTKIIATLGPSCNTEDTIQQLLTSGVDVFRLNFSHGTPAERTRLVEIIRHVATEHGKYVPIMGDIQGPKLRIGEVDGVVQVQNGATFVITTHEVLGNTSMVSTPFTHLPREVQLGHRILINDGLVELVVTAVDATSV